MPFPAPGKKEPQLPQNEPQVVAGTHQQRIHRIARSTFQIVAVQASVFFHVTEHRLNRIAAFEQSLQARGDATFLSRDVDRRRRLMMAAIPTVNTAFLRTLPGQASDLIQCFR